MINYQENKTAILTAAGIAAALAAAGAGYYVYTKTKSDDTSTLDATLARADKVQAAFTAFKADAKNTERAVVMEILNTSLTAALAKVRKTITEGKTVGAVDQSEIDRLVDFIEEAMKPTAA